MWKTCTNTEKHFCDNVTEIADLSFISFISWSTEDWVYPIMKKISKKLK